MSGIELCLLGASSLSFRVNTQDRGPLATPGLGVDSEISVLKWEGALGALFAWRHWESCLLTSAFCPSPPHAARPVSWRYWSLPRPVCRRRTLGDLYAISWRQGCLRRCFLPRSGLGAGSLRLHAPPALGGLCLLHVRKGSCLCRVCVGMQVWEEGAWGLKFPGLRKDVWGLLGC